MLGRGDRPVALQILESIVYHIKWPKSTGHAVLSPLFGRHRLCDKQEENHAFTGSHRRCYRGEFGHWAGYLS